MAARKLASETSGVSGRKVPVGKRFIKGVCPNPGGLSKAQRAAADAARDLALSHGQELLPDGRSRARAALDTLFDLGFTDRNVPACTAYLDRVGYKPVERVEGSVDGIVLTIRKRVAVADDPR